MRTLRTRPLLLATASALTLFTATAQAADWPNERGIRIDQSLTRGQAPAPNQEREGADFRSLPASSVGRQEMREVMVTPPALPSRTVTQDVTLDGAKFASGRAELTGEAMTMLASMADGLRGKRDLRVDVVGHTDDQRISPALRATYPDNQALSEARARSVAEFVGNRLGLPASARTAIGKGESEPLVPNDTPAHMAQNRRTVLRVSYSETIVPPAPAPVTRRTLVSTDDCAPTGPSGLPFAISVDGQPLNGDTNQQEADRQRCVDVALDRADIQIKYDPMNVAPALNAWAVPGAVRRGEPIVLRTYSNYAWWVKRAEIRVFTRGQSTSDTPAAVIPVEIGGDARFAAPTGGADEIGYVLRVYDAKGRFDETGLKPIRLLDAGDAAATRERIERDALSGYGENSLKVRNIDAQGGAVTVSGKDIKPGESVSALGMPVPVDEHGRFVFRQIMPSGPHAVAVAVKQADGRVATFSRNLSIADKDWFYVALADLTVARGSTIGPAALVTGDRRYDKKTTVDGRGAFYLKGKIQGKYLLTASADTQEQPFKDMFTNFGRKDPRYLLRRIDPNRYYPVYGDDSTIVDDTPTQGKFYVRLERDASSVMWGNFQTSWTGTELTQYSRGLYGGDLVLNSKATTSDGLRRTQVEAFAAEPGTLQSREEFRGTGGSLYYFRRQDVTEGSERLWVEIRDKDSGIVLQRTLLTPIQDYDIDYLQGRLTLRSALPSVADGSQLVQTSTLNGNPVYLVGTYEYVPGLTAVNGATVGVRGSQWLTDNIRVGGTYYHQGESGYDQTLKGVDGTLRYKPGTWLRGEMARSKGIGTDLLTSNTGGFDFSQNLTPNRAANAYRVDGAVDLKDLGRSLGGRLTGYWQDRGLGYSGPGLVTPGGEALRQAGGSAIIPLGRQAEIALKADDTDRRSLSMNAQEAALRLKLDAQWGVSVGVRRDDYQTGAGGTLLNASPYLSRNGERADAIVRVDFRPLKAGQDPKAVAKAAAEAAAAKSQGDAAATAPAPAPYLPIDSTALAPDQIDTSGPAASLMTTGVNDANGTLGTAFDPATAAGLAASETAGLSYRPWNAYGFVQQTLSRTGQRLDNDRAGLGLGWRVTPKLKLSGEVSGGERGLGGRAGGEYAVDDRSTLYFTYARESEVSDLNYAGIDGMLTAGGRMRLNERLNVFAEQRRTSGNGRQSLTNGFGVDFAPAKNWTTGVKFERGTVDDRVAGDLRREAVSLTAGYRDTGFKWLSLAEYRRDRTVSLGTVDGTCNTGSQTDNTLCGAPAGSDTRETFLFKNNVTFQLTPAWRLLGTLNLSRSNSTKGAFFDGDYTEAVLAAAYRPVDNNRWNALFKYTFFYNLPASSQLDGFSNGPLDFTQKSHVLNVDGIYDLVPWLSVGLKYGLRVGELRDSRTSGGTWYDSKAQLWVLRGDIHFVRKWDALVELRTLSVSEADDRRSGILIGIYRHIGDRAKIGVGYNFTDFSDDLTDLSYRSRGVFLNVLATF